VAFDVAHTPKARNVTKATGLYMRGEQDDDLTVNRTALVLRHEYSLTARTILFGQLGYLHDTFKLIDYLIAPTAGLGFKIVNTDPTKFLVDAGAGGVWEKNPTPTHASGAITSSERLTHELTSTASIKQRWPDCGRQMTSATPLHGVGRLATKISDKIQLSIDLLETYKSKPPTADTKKSDIAFVTAVAAKF
jgi:putative salt-induced outer membrane protein YdiY